MRTYKLATAFEIYGDQLVDEILKAIGQNVSGRYTFISPDQVLLPDDFDEFDLTTIIGGHVPDPDYFIEDVVQRETEAATGQLRRNAPGELTYLASVIEDINTMELEELRMVVKRLAIQVQFLLKPFSSSDPRSAPPEQTPGTGKPTP